MPVNNQPTILLASNEPAVLKAIEPILLELGAQVSIALSAEATLAAMTAPLSPNLVLLDSTLPDMDIDRLLAAARDETGRRRFPIVLISDSVAGEWADRVGEGGIEDIIPQRAEPITWRLRLDAVLRTHSRMRELERLREAAALQAQMDPLTGVYNRSTLLSLLFRETDRVQRMQTSLCLILLDIDDFGHWNQRLGVDACDELLVHVVARLSRLLRSYDMLGRMGNDEFLIALPGCSEVNAVLLAERVRLEVFSVPFRVSGRAIRLSACSGIASSQGRSPVVVLREVEQVLRQAKDAGPESIQCSADCPSALPPPVAFLSPTSGDDLLAW
jgi:diguanylate cyclase (GGDEF)-like protein